MPSTFTWLDYSENERRKMLDVIELFGERTTRDELGLGGVRDAFADMLFPGTSTIQTRAKYFLFVPWIYLALEAKRVSSAAIDVRLRKAESELMRILADSGDTSGLIGRRAKENVRRLPSSVYWQGMAVWGIRVFPGSQEEYHRSLDVFYARHRVRRSARNEYEGEGVAEPDLHNWHTGLPTPPDGFPENASFDLRKREAEYLRERVLTTCPESLLAYLLRERVPVGDYGFAWEIEASLPASLREWLMHGRNFSEVMLGAQLLYNLMIAEQRAWQEKIDEYLALLHEWWEVVQERADELASWDRAVFWRMVFRSNPRVSVRAKAFIDRWVGIVRDAGTLTGVSESIVARELIHLRESQLKGGLSRLRSGRARELWSGAAGAGQMDLRWRSSQRIITDILAGLEESQDA